MSSLALNYAHEYSRALDQVYPFVLNFGALYGAANNQTYRWVNAKTIEIPNISTSGRKDASRSSISALSSRARNYDNSWETKTLSNERCWETLVHPMDIDQTNMVGSISNITKVFNEEQKFPEMDAYCVSKIYSDWTSSTMGTAHTASTTSLTASSILGEFDSFMEAMDEARVPANGRILYCTFAVKKLLEQAAGAKGVFDLQSNNGTINRVVSRLDEVEVIGVPSSLMKTAYDFTTGYAAATTASQINMMLIHPSAVITPVSYAFAQLDAPSAGSQGKYMYYEESFEDVFVLKNKKDAIMFNITAYVAPTPTPTPGV